jgi:pSer/pThr/pTyr-binding forkhead associated (FHA) protein
VLAAWRDHSARHLHSSDRGLSTEHKEREGHEGGPTMSAIVTLRIKNGQLAGRTFEFNNGRRCLIGRGEDCAIRLPTEPEFQSISRHHCLLDIDPPQIRVRDAGSRNGTMINGMQIGRPETWHLPPETTAGPLFDYDLDEGDELQVGGTVFQVSVSVPEASGPAWTGQPAAEKELAACG